jgi:pyruvate,water dikinase
MTVAGAEGTREVPMPRALRREPVLDTEQVKTLACLALALENSMGWAVDLECAFQQRRLYLLQCRPITTLALRSNQRLVFGMPADVAAHKGA